MWPSIGSLLLFIISSCSCKVVKSHAYYRYVSKCELHKKLASPASASHIIFCETWKKMRRHNASFKMHSKDYRTSRLIECLQSCHSQLPYIGAECPPGHRRSGTGTIPIWKE